MTFVTRKTLLTLTALSVVAVLAIGGFIWSGFYDVGADDQHTPPVYALLKTMRNRSIEVRASELRVPDNLQDAARITQGAGNYNAMCMGCHLAPGMDATELSRGLYPAPPELTKATVDAARAFWVIKHGIKASGMPAWGESMGDEYVWNMAAFLQQLPKLDAAQYQALVASSGGHDHGGGETIEHAHAEGTPADHHDAPTTGARAGEAQPHVDAPGTPAHDHPPADPHAGMDMTGGSEQASPPVNGTVEHRHADGTVESHPAPATRPESPPPADNTDDGHEHQH